MHRKREISTGGTDLGTRRDSGAEGEIFGRRLVILAGGAKFGQEA